MSNEDEAQVRRRWCEGVGRLRDIAEVASCSSVDGAVLAGAERCCKGERQSAGGEDA